MGFIRAFSHMNIIYFDHIHALFELSSCPPIPIIPLTLSPGSFSTMKFGSSILGTSFAFLYSCISAILGGFCHSVTPENSVQFPSSTLTPAQV